MPLPNLSSLDRATRPVVVVLTIGVFAAVVMFVTLRTRSGLRQQILQREAATLAAVTSLLLQAEAENYGDAPGALVAATLSASKYKGVFVVRTFDEQRRLVGAQPLLLSEDPPSDEDWRQLRGRAVARFHARVTDDLALLRLRPEQPVLEAWVPLRRTHEPVLRGAAQFWIDGADVQREWKALDEQLLAQAALAWGAGALVIVVTMTWAFRRLAAANRELRVRSDNLARANRELVLAAKTSALGSVTAHLIHALKNPIAGLEVFVASQADSAARDPAGEDLAAATELTRRLRGMVNDVVAVLRDEQGESGFELSGDELVELALAKARPLAAARNVTLEADVAASVVISGRRASLAALALYNLLQNALEATPAGRAVRVAARGRPGEAFEITVADEGPGLPEAVRARLFEPCASTKIGGTGIGLALSQQLARHAAGRIELLATSASGTCFRLVLDPES